MAPGILLQSKIPRTLALVDGGWSKKSRVAENAPSIAVLGTSWFFTAEFGMSREACGDGKRRTIEKAGGQACIPDLRGYRLPHRSVGGAGVGQVAVGRSSAEIAEERDAEDGHDGYGGEIGGPEIGSEGAESAHDLSSVAEWVVWTRRGRPFRRLS